MGAALEDVLGIRVILGCGCAAEVVDADYVSTEDGYTGIEWVDVDTRKVRVMNVMEPATITAWGGSYVTISPDGSATDNTDYFDWDDYERESDGDWEHEDVIEERHECRSCEATVRSATVFLQDFDGSWYRLMPDGTLAMIGGDPEEIETWEPVDGERDEHEPAPGVEVDPVLDLLRSLTGAA